VKEPSSPDGFLVVFAQRAQALLEVEAWNRQGERFFSTRIGLADPGVRRVEGRFRQESDLLQADIADSRARGGGLGELARRCQTVWLVERESASDLLALQLAAVMASVLLGPILDPAASQLFGVKTARAKIDAATRLHA
jgi:hypothetical protein